MTRTRVLALTVAALAAGLAACSVITGLNADYTRQDDETGAGDDAMAATDTPGSSGDGNDDPDTSRDAGFQGEFCEQYDGAANVAFCWDFSLSGTSFGAGFNGGYQTADAGSLSISPEGGSNGSPYLVAKLTHATASSQAYVERSIGDDAGESFTTYSQHDLQFKFMVIHNDGINTTALGSLGFKTCKGCQPTVTGIANYLQGGEDRIDISSPPGAIALPYVAAADRQWLRGEVNLKRSVAGVPYAMTITVFDATNNPVTLETGTFAADAGSAELLFGAYFSSPSDAGTSSITVGIDDIVYSHVR